MPVWVGNPDARRRIKMIVPVPLPDIALEMFAAQFPPGSVPADVAIALSGTREGANILDSLYEMTLADAFCLEAGETAEAEGFSAVCINSMSDSGVAALRSRLTIPVVGPGESSVHLAAQLGKRFSILTMWDRWRPLYDKVLMQTGLGARCASVRAIGVRPDAQELLAGKEEIVFEKLESAAKAAIEADGADVIVLGSTTMHQSHRYLADRLPVPVINPGLAALAQTLALIDLGLSHSKKAFVAPERANDGLLATVPPRAFG